MLTDAEERALRELAAATAAVDRRFARRLAAGPLGRRHRQRRIAVLAAALVGAGTVESMARWPHGPAVAAAAGGLVVAAVLGRRRARVAPRSRPAVPAS